MLNTQNGFTSKDTVVSGSLIVTNGIIGNVVSSSYALTSSYSHTSLTSSFVQNVISSSYSDYSVSSSLALEAEFVPLTSTNKMVPPNINNSNYISPNIIFSATQISSPNPVISSSIFVCPFQIKKNCSVEGVGIFCSSSNTGIISMGLYNNNSINMLPNQLLFQTSSSGGLGNFTFLQIPINPSYSISEDNIYWIAMWVTSSQYYVVSATTSPLVGSGMFNRNFNPTLGSSIPILSNSIRNIGCYYTTSLNSTLPLTMSQNTSSYVVLSYNTQIPIMPFIKVK